MFDIAECAVCSLRFVQKIAPFRAASATAAKTAGSRRSLTFTKFARSSHAREASVNGQIIAPLVFLHGESEINTLTIPLTQRFLESPENLSKKGSLVGAGQSPAFALPDKPKFEALKHQSSTT